ncbi:MAG: winged helix-turn-helix domain-containing protein [Microthrixaceae bacterium]
MRTAAPALLPLFRSRLQGELLALLLDEPDREWPLNQLSKSMGSPYPTVVGEVRRLTDAGLITARTIGRAKLVQANSSSPYFAPLRQLVSMAFGPPLVIKEEFAGLEGIEELFIYGSWAARYNGEVGPAPRDVDVMIIGSASRDEVYEATRRSEQRLLKEVNVTMRTAAQWVEAEDGFSQQVKQSSQVQLFPHPDGAPEPLS